MASIEHLPVELLLMIFKYYVTKGEEILFTLAFVCKRWHKLTKDISLWKNVHLTLPMNGSKRDLIKSYSVLYHAPCLRSLHIETHFCCEYSFNPITLHILKNKTLTILMGICFTGMVPVPYRVWLLDTLYANRHTLKSATCVLDSTTTSSNSLTPSEILRELKSLVILRIDTMYQSNHFSDQDKLNYNFPSLERLIINHRTPFIPDSIASLASPQLKRLCLTESVYGETRPANVQLLHRSTNLEVLNCYHAYIHHLGGHNLLTDLSVVTSGVMDAERCGDLAYHLRIIPNLTYLTVSTRNIPKLFETTTEEFMEWLIALNKNLKQISIQY